MVEKPKVIGISGFARCGKNTFGNLIGNLLKKYKHQVEFLSFAESLRNELKEFLFDKLDIDVFSEDPKTKDIYRPILVAYAKRKREITKGRYFVDKLDKRVKNNIKNNIISIITDLRYNEYSYDESQMVKYNQGAIVFIKKYKLIDNIKLFDSAPNDEETINAPKVEKIANFLIEWPQTDNTSVLNNFATDFYDKFYG